MIKTLTDLELSVEICINCGCAFGIPDNLLLQRRRDGRTFYCPNGHGQIYGNSIENQLAKTKDALSQMEATKEWWRIEAEAKSKQLTVTRGQLTKTKNRIAKGICPCCHRQFVDMKRHMETKHPEYSSVEA